jgi:DNA-binding GntR family transcriptional regulator
MTLSNRVAAQIREQIVSGVLPEGAPLLQEKLADDFKVSRIPVREAMKQLEAEGLITSYPHRTSVVADCRDIRAKSTHRVRSPSAGTSEHPG